MIETINELPGPAGGRPWYQRSEFYLSAFVIVLGGLLGGGLLGADNVWTAIVGQVLTALAAVGYTAGMTIVKTAEGRLTAKPGWRSSEFWQVMAASALGVVHMLNVLPTGGMVETLLAAVLAVLAPGVYAVQRGKVKAAAFLPLLALIVLVVPSGCATVDRGLGAAHDGLTVVGDLVLPPVNAACMKEARACNATGVTDPAKCTRWQSCVETRRAFVEGLKLGHQGIRTTSQAVTAARANGWLDGGQ